MHPVAPRTSSPSRVPTRETAEAARLKPRELPDAIDALAPVPRSGARAPRRLGGGGADDELRSRLGLGQGAPASARRGLAGVVAERAERPRVDATDGMSANEKYAFYKQLIERSGGKLDERPGRRHIVGLRSENQRKDVYDDRVALLWKDDEGRAHVRELPANLEASYRFRGRYGRDMDGDGVKDGASLVPGNYAFTKGRSRTLGRVLRPTATTPVRRDTDEDGKGDALDPRGAGRSILFHQGRRNSSGSAGCQTIPPGDFGRFWRELGGQKRFPYTLVEAR